MLTKNLSRGLAASSLALLIAAGAAVSAQAQDAGSARHDAYLKQTESQLQDRQMARNPQGPTSDMKLEIGKAPQLEEQHDRGR